MYYFMIEATPKPDNAEAQDVGGAYVNCWVNFKLLDGAEVLANYYIEQGGWTPGEIHERKWVEKKDYPKGDKVGLPYYLEAEADGASFVFNSWDVDAEDADDEETTEEPPPNLEQMLQGVTDENRNRKS